MSRSKDKVAIVGFAGTSRGQAPYGDDAFEIWSLNNAWQFVERWDRWFELHPPELIKTNFMRQATEQSGEDRHTWLTKTHGKPIYMQEHYSEYPDSVAWPRAEINAWLAERGCPADYYTSSIAEMLAHAIYEGFKEIHLYGVDMLQDEEYYYQRAGAEWYIGLAVGMGIKIYVPERSALLKANYVYGYTEPKDSDPAMQQIVELMDRNQREALEAREKALKVAHLHDGARQAYQSVMETPLIPPVTMTDKDQWQRWYEDVLKLAAEKRKLAEQEREKALAQANIHEGARQAFDAGLSWSKHVSRGGKI